MLIEEFPLKASLLRVSREAAWAPIAVVFLHSLAGELFGHEPYVDPTMHFLGGIAITFFFHCLFALPFAPFGLLSRLTLNLLAFALACTAALFWEFGEYFLDQWLGTNMQRSLDNTMRDLLLGTTGAFLYLVQKQFRGRNKHMSFKRILSIGAVLSLAFTAMWNRDTLQPQELFANTGGKTMKITRVYTGADNKSHFEDIEVELKDGGKAGFMSSLQKATGVVFRETDGSYNFDFHNAPRRQYVVNLEGEVEIEVGDGTKRLLRSGDILLAEDTTGQGHISRAVGGKPRKSLFITLD